MTQPGDTKTITVYRESTAGVAVTGLLVGNFSATINGVAASLTSFTEVGSGHYSFSVTLPSTTGIKSLLIFADNTDIITEDTFAWDLGSQDIDALYALASSAGGIAVGETRTTGQLPDQYDGDSFDEVITIPEAALAKVGISSLADADSIVAGYKLPFPAAESQDAQAGAFTVAIVSDTSGNRAVRLTAAAGFISLATGSASQTYAVDVGLNKTTRKYTAARLTFNLVWQAGTA